MFELFSVQWNRTDAYCSSWSFTLQITIVICCTDNINLRILPRVFVFCRRMKIRFGMRLGVLLFNFFEPFLTFQKKITHKIFPRAEIWNTFWIRCEIKPLMSFSALIWVLLLIKVLLFTHEWHKIPQVKYYATRTRNSSGVDTSPLEGRIYITDLTQISSSIKGNAAPAFHLLCLYMKTTFRKLKYTWQV